MRTKKWKTWAIDTRSVEGHNLIGPYWFVQYKPECLDGCVPALFRTREIARKMVVHVRRSFPRATVVRVHVEVAEV